MSRLGDRFAVQETTMATLQAQFRTRSTLDGVQDSAQRRDQLVQTSCNEGTQLTEPSPQVPTMAVLCSPDGKAKTSGQRFREMVVDDTSTAFQGTAGVPPDQAKLLNQKFGKMSVSKGSTAIQGQLDATSFAALLGKT